jgi:phage terminase large subunit
MERDRDNDLMLYEHIWLGGYQLVGEGAYYAEALSRARIENRVCSLPIERDSLIYTGWDIGIDDFNAVWAAQRIGREIHVIDYIEDRNKPAAYYAQWARDNGYDTGLALLPHDAGVREKGSGKTYQEFLKAAGLVRSQIIPRTQNLMTDIQTVRGFIDKCWFDKDRCAHGLKCLGAYHVSMNEKTQTPGLRPVHDWSSHGTDAFRTLSKLAHYYEHDDAAAGRYGPHVSINRDRARHGRGGTTLSIRGGGSLGRPGAVRAGR